MANAGVWFCRELGVGGAEKTGSCFLKVDFRVAFWLSERLGHESGARAGARCAFGKPARDL